MQISKKAEEHIKTIISFYTASEEIGRPRLSNMKLERSVSGSKEAPDNYDKNFNKQLANRKHITKKLGQIADQCRSMINGEVTRYESKQCKVDNCDHKNKRVPIDQKFCAGCGRSYG
tara:strand:- start:5694 stop:6044 length:351 start_codon:yes stop_codon:yes gene_type:complete